VNYRVFNFQLYSVLFLLFLVVLGLGLRISWLLGRCYATNQPSVTTFLFVEKLGKNNSCFYFNRKKWKWLINLLRQSRCSLTDHLFVCSLCVYVSLYLHHHLSLHFLSSFLHSFLPPHIIFDFIDVLFIFPPDPHLIHPVFDVDKEISHTEESHREEGHHLPVENGIKASCFLKLSSVSRKCPG
jgi:hypothetical protein